MLIANVVPFYTVFPFSFTGLPGIFGKLTEAANRYRKTSGHTKPIRNGAENFMGEIFAGGGMFIESTIGTRAQKSDASRESGPPLMSFGTAISQKKLHIGWGIFRHLFF